MPRRSTHYYTSENAGPVESDKLYIYYCKFTGKHALTSDVDIESLPRRNTDNAYILDKEKHVFKFYTTGAIRFVSKWVSATSCKA